MTRNLIVCIGGWACPDSLWDRTVSLISDFHDVKIISADKILANRSGFWQDFAAQEAGRKITVVGWSLGGILALEADLRKYCCFEKIILLGSCARMTAAENYSAVALRDLKAMQLDLTRNPAKTVRNFWKSILAEEDCELVLEDLVRSAEKSGIETLALGLKFLEDSDFRTELAQIHTAATVIHGTDDNIIPCSSGKFLAENIRSSKLIILEKTGHDLPLSAPKVIADQVLTNGFPTVDSSASFSKAAESYDAWSLVQQRIARYLLDFSRPFITRPSRSLDIGCGTGFFSKLLIDEYPLLGVVGMDNAAGMISRSRDLWKHEERLSFIQADAHTFDSDHKFDLITSNCMLQWSQNLDSVVNTKDRALTADGLIVFSTLIEGSLRELSNCYQQLTGSPLPSIKMHTADYYQQCLRDCGFKVIAFEQKSFSCEYNNSLQALLAFKRVGATTPRQKYKPLSPRQIRALCSLYDEKFLNENAMVPCSYEVLFIVARRETLQLNPQTKIKS